MKVAAIIPAGGLSRRFGGATPKQFVKVDGKEIFIHTLSIFQKNREVDEVALAVPEQYLEKASELLLKRKINKVVSLVPGGNERQDSVLNALTSLSLKKKDLVIVHDAARPLLSQKILTDAIQTAKKKGNAVTAILGRDTLLRQSNERFEYIDRSGVYYVQTPQIFRAGDLQQAFELAQELNFISTDESNLINLLGIKMNIVEGSLFNFKITSKSDLELFKRLMKKR